MKRVLVMAMIVVVVGAGRLMAGEVTVEASPEREEDQVLYVQEGTSRYAVLGIRPVLSLCNEQGKCAHITFGKDEVAYSGDLPVADSAKILFEAGFQYSKEQCLLECMEYVNKALKEKEAEK